MLETIFFFKLAPRTGSQRVPLQPDGPGLQDRERGFPQGKGGGQRLSRFGRYFFIFFPEDKINYAREIEEVHLVNVVFDRIG